MCVRLSVCLSFDWLLMDDVIPRKWGRRMFHVSPWLKGKYSVNVSKIILTHSSKTLGKQPICSLLSL